MQNIVSASIVAVVLQGMVPAAVYADAKALFEKSAQSLSQTNTAYQTVETDFSTAKRSFDALLQRENKVATALHGFIEELEKVEGRLSKLSLQQVYSLQSLQKDVDALRSSVQEKYSAAERSAQALDKPQTTAALFQSAQNEAAVLQETAAVLAQSSESVKHTQELRDRLITLIAQLQTKEAELKALQIEESEGLRNLQSSLAENVQVSNRYIYTVRLCHAWYIHNRVLSSSRYFSLSVCLSLSFRLSLSRLCVSVSVSVFLLHCLWSIVTEVHISYRSVATTRRRVLRKVLSL